MSDRPKEPAAPERCEDLGCSRRDAMSVVGVGLLVSGLGACRRSPPDGAPPGEGTPVPPVDDDQIFSSARAIAAAVRAKEISSEEITTAYLRRIESVNPALNAVVHLVRERALKAARSADAALAGGELLGPLHGVPMTIKDSLDTGRCHLHRRHPGPGGLRAGTPSS